MSGVPQGTFGTIDHHVHRQRRAAVKTFVSKRTVRNVQSAIRAVIHQLCRNLDEYEASQEVCLIGLQYLAWSTDSVSRYLEDRPFGLLDNVERAREWDRTLKTVVELTPLVKQFPLFMPLILHLPGWLVEPISPALNLVLRMHRRMQRRAHKACAEITTPPPSPPPASSSQPFHPSTPPSPPNIYDAILATTSIPPSEKDPDRIAQEALTLLVGGSSTSARVMARLTFHITSNPAVSRRLFADLQAAFPHDYGNDYPTVTATAEPSHPELEQLERISYLAPVSMTISSILMDPSIFHDPYSFLPDRWLSDDPEEQARLEKFFVPFGKGT
ncbi:MAG: hypothetical protein Q9163_004436, partial [Psora crenata]